MNEAITKFFCVNCDQEFNVSKTAKLYCSPKCGRYAAVVRYVRARRRDGTYKNPDIQDAIDVKFVEVCGKKGYYDLKARRLSPELRGKVIERDKGLCCKCGKLGNEIHHIDGSSPDMENLQLLCHDCHMEKTKLRYVKLTPEDERYAEIKAKFDGLWNRINAVSPERDCYDSENWDAIQEQLMSERQQLLKQIKEDSQGTSKKKDTFEAKLIIQEIDDLAELELQLDALELQKQAQIDQILTSEIKSKIEAIKLDFANSVQDVKKNVENSKKRIKEDVLRYGSTVEGKILQARWNKGQPSLNWKSLKEYAESHPEILDFWKEGTPFVSFYKVNKDKKRK